MFYYLVMYTVAITGISFGIYCFYSFDNMSVFFFFSIFVNLLLAIYWASKIVD